MPAHNQGTTPHKALMLLLCVWLAAMQWLGGLHSATVRIAAQKPVGFSAGLSLAGKASLHDQLFAKLEARSGPGNPDATDTHPAENQGCAFLDAHLNTDTCGSTPAVVSLHDTPSALPVAHFPERISRFLALGKHARGPPVV